MIWVYLIITIAAAAAAYAFAPKGWRTWLVNAAVVALSLTAYAIEPLRDALPPNLAVYVIPAMGAINAFLRYVTTTPVMKST